MQAEIHFQSTMEEELERYLVASEGMIKGPWRTVEDKAKATYDHAQVLVCVGKHSEALPFFAEAQKLLYASRADPVWKRLFCSVCVNHATALDFLGQYDKAAEVFKVVMAEDPTGFHIGDYALFLHRRKRDFDQAQAYVFRVLRFGLALSSCFLDFRAQVLQKGIRAVSSTFFNTS